MRRLLLILVAFVFVAGGGLVAWKLTQPTNPVSNARLLLRRGDLKAAQRELHDAIRAKPEDWDAHLQLAGVDLMTNDPIAAEKEAKFARDYGAPEAKVVPLLVQSYLGQNKAREILAEFRTDDVPPEARVSVLVARAMAYVTVNDAGTALAMLTEAEKTTPGAIELPLTEAQIAMARQDYQAAGAAVDRALHIDAKQQDALLIRAELLNLSGDRKGALDIYDSLIAPTPDDARTGTARLKRAGVLLSQGQDAEAQKDVDFVVKNRPQDANGVFLQGVLQARARHFQDADVSFQRLSDMTATFPRLTYFTALVKYSLGQVEQASDFAGRYLARNPTDPDAIKLMARIELASRRSDRASDRLAEAIASGRRDAEMLDLLGRAYQLSAKPGQALDAFRQANAMAPGNAEILTDLARARLIAGDPNGAADSLQESLTVAPDQTRIGEALVVASLDAGDLDRAANALDRLRKQVGETDAVGVLGALIKQMQLDLPGAEAILRDVIARFPTAIPARLNLARLRSIQGDPGDAEQILRDALAKDPANEAALAMLREFYIRQNRARDIIGPLEAAHTAAPGNTGLTIALADAYAQANGAQKALDLLDHSAAAAGSSGQAFAATRASILASSGHRDEAIEALRQVLVATPGDVRTRQLLASLLSAADRTREARAVLREGLVVLPGNVALMQALVGVDLKTGNMPAALATVADLQADSRNMPGAAGLKGDLYYNQKQYADAATAYQDALKASPAEGLAIRAATALNAAGKPDDAARVLDRWTTANPKDDGALQTLALLDITGNRLPAAEKHLSAVLDHAPRNVNALNNLAWVYQQQKDPRALKTAQQAYMLGPNANVADTLGWILVSNGDAPRGVPLLRQAVSEDPSDPSYSYHLAVGLKNTQRPQEAVTVLKRITDLPADYPDKKAARALMEQLATR